MNRQFLQIMTAHEPGLPRALNVLERFLTSPADVGRRLFIPHPEGLMRPFRGSAIHIAPELFLQDEGTNPIDFPNDQHDLRAGELCVIPCGMPHREDRPRQHPFNMLVFMFPPHRVSFHFYTIPCPGAQPVQSAFRVIESVHVPRIIQTIDTLTQLPREDGKWYRKTVNALCFSVLTWLNAILRSDVGGPSRYAPRVEEVIHLMTTNLHDHALGTACLARWVDCTPNYLSELFHTETGYTLKRYLNRERLHKAQFLLRNSPMIIKEVAGACGYVNAHYFSRIFRTHFGCSPQQWRQGVQERHIG